MLQANRLVQEANMLAEALHKDTLFKVTLTVPRSFLSPIQNVETSEETTNEVAIRVLHKQRGTDSVWTTEILEEKVLTMREMYEHMEDGGSLLVSHTFIQNTQSLCPSVVVGRLKLFTLCFHNLLLRRMNLLGQTLSMTWSSMLC